MRLLGLAMLLAIVASPAWAESADAPVTVLRGASAPPPPADPPVVVQTTVIVPEIVYVPTYYPGYVFYYPNFFVPPRRFVNQPFTTTGLMHQRR
jgi:hypothetical protein